MSTIDPGHAARRQRLTLLGTVLLIAGAAIGIIGLVKFATPFLGSTDDFFADPHGTMDRDSANGFTGILLLAVGSFSAMAGLALLRFANHGRLLRYAAGEIAPVAVDTIDYVARESREGLTAIASAVTGSSSREVVKVRCRACGALDSEDARFCSACAKPL